MPSSSFLTALTPNSSFSMDRDILCTLNLFNVSYVSTFIRNSLEYIYTPSASSKLLTMVKLNLWRSKLIIICARFLTFSKSTFKLAESVDSYSISARSFWSIWDLSSVDSDDPHQELSQPLDFYSAAFFFSSRMISALALATSLA